MKYQMTSLTYLTLRLQRHKRVYFQQARGKYKATAILKPKSVDKEELVS